MIETATPWPADHRSGFIAVVGRPNVGKSTLLNRLLGQKIAITSPKPQTTRDQLLGILTTDDAQYLFLDTPGIHKPLNKLGEYMVSVAAETMEDADVVLWLVDMNAPPREEERGIAELMQRLHKKHKLPPVVVGFNQSDLWNRNEGDACLRVDEYTGLADWLLGRARPDGTPLLSTAIFSAASGAGVDALRTLLHDLLPLGPRYYPEDQVTDLQLRFIAGELIREKALLLLQDEVPHSVAVEVDEFIERGPKLT